MRMSNRFFLSRGFWACIGSHLTHFPQVSRMSLLRLYDTCVISRYSCIFQLLFCDIFYIADTTCSKPFVILHAPVSWIHPQVWDSLQSLYRTGGPFFTASATSKGPHDGWWKYSDILPGKGDGESLVTDVLWSCRQILKSAYMYYETSLRNVIQFNSKTFFKDGDPVSSQLIFPGAIQTCEQYNNFSYI